MLTFRCDFTAPVQRFDSIAAQARDTGRILKRFAGYLVWTGKERFAQQPGWAPLAPSTLLKYSQTRTSAITAAGAVRRGYEQHALAQLRRKAKVGGEALDNLVEFARLSRGGNALDSLLAGGAGSGSRAVEGLRRNLLRAAKQRAAGKRVTVGGNRRKSERHQVLGKLRKSIERRIEGTAAVVESRVPWSGVHNYGGAAGHGAQLPARVFLTITSDNKVALAQILLEHLTEA